MNQDDGLSIVLATYGTTGDVQPLQALALELRRRGHAVKLAAPENFGKRTSALGIEFVPLGPAIDMREMREIWGWSAKTGGDVVEFIRRAMAPVLRHAPAMITRLAEACVGVDGLVCMPYQIAGRMVHDLYRVPYATFTVSPFISYNRQFACEGARLVNELRAAYDLAPLDDPLGVGGSSQQLVMHGASSFLFRRPRHWPNHHVLTGSLFLDEPWIVDRELEAFVEAGPPPIVFSFGSMLHEKPDELADIVLSAATHLRRRVVVQRGWTGLSFRAAPDFLKIVDFVPHHWLFPRAACVVHSGGSGTTAATLRAGVPSVVVPHILDQFVWGGLLQDRGCASESIPYSELTSDRLIAALEAALGERCTRAAKEASLFIRKEDGAATAADLIMITFGMRRQSANA